MWANPLHNRARASAARQHRERPRATPPLSRRGRRCLPFDRVRPSPVSSSGALRTYPSAAGRFGPGTSRPVAQAASRACVVNTNDPTAGLSITANPPRVSVRHRRSLPATRGHGKRQRLAPLSAQPQPVARRSTASLLIKPFDRRQSQLPPRAPCPRSPAPAAPATTPRARSRAPPPSARTAPAALAAADRDSRSLPSSRRPSTAPTRVSTAAASSSPCRARRRAPRLRPTPSTRPPGTSTCRLSSEMVPVFRTSR